MPRGKKTVYSGSCTTCAKRIASVRILKSKKGEFRKLRKYCGKCRKRMEVKLKEEKHSN